MPIFFGPVSQKPVRKWRSNNDPDLVGTEAESLINNAIYQSREGKENEGLVAH